MSQAVNGAHDGGIFSICVIKEGRLLTGGKDRKLIEWDMAYQRTGHDHEVSVSWLTGRDDEFSETWFTRGLDVTMKSV